MKNRRFSQTTTNLSLTGIGERVKELRKQRKRPNRYDEAGLFSGLLFCDDYTAHFIRTDLLTAGVLSNLRSVATYTAKHQSCFMKLLVEQSEDGGRRRNAARKKEPEAAA